MNLSNFSNWLYPGMKVKRWIGLASLSTLALGGGLLLLIGKQAVGEFYSFLNGNPYLYYTAAAVLIAGGGWGLISGLNSTAKSLLTGIAQENKKTSDVIWKERQLSKGPSIAAIGGGTGLSVLLTGLKHYTSNLTAIVTVMDDGGSSGRLREEMDILPPGDIRNCIIALSDDESIMGKVFQHRFQSGGELSGHSLGNLFIAGMEEITGGFDRSIEEASKLLNIRGQVLPSTLADTDLEATLSSGEQVRGESSISEKSGAIKKVELADKAPPHPEAVSAIENAEYIILGPGSLFTSLIPNLLVENVADEIKKSEARKFFVVNLMTETGETDSFTALDHVEAINEYLDFSCFDWIIVNDGEVGEELQKQYAEEGAELVKPNLSDPNQYGVGVLQEDLVQTIRLEGKPTLKHDPHRLAELIISH